MKTYLQTLRRRKALILLIVVIMPVAAYVATQGRPDRYRSSTQVLLQPGSTVDQLVNGTAPSNSDPVAQERLLQTQADLGQVPAVSPVRRDVARIGRWRQAGSDLCLTVL
jgi:uncharacterized protein involved in exopolysaccharide biosynthesis